jgi:hypothetical protein
MNLASDDALLARIFVMGLALIEECRVQVHEKLQRVENQIVDRPSVTF